MNRTRFEVVPIGTVESPLIDPATAPKQGNEGSPDAWLVFDSALLHGLQGAQSGDRILVLT